MAGSHQQGHMGPKIAQGKHHHIVGVGDFRRESVSVVLVKYRLMPQGIDDLFQLATFSLAVRATRSDIAFLRAVGTIST